jgi:hypothetical protein
MAGFLSRREYERVLGDVGFQDVTGVDLTLAIASVVRARSPGRRPA